MNEEFFDGDDCKEWLCITINDYTFKNFVLTDKTHYSHISIIANLKKKRIM